MTIHRHRKGNMKNNKFKFASLSTLIFLLGSILFVCAGTVAPVFAALLIVHEESYFVVEDNGHYYKCYSFEDEEGTPVPGVAIAWGEDPSNTPTDLTIPQTVNHSGDEYTVRAIAKAGFRYCDFETITLPQTIEKIGEEAFAYCTSMTSFSIPHLVEKIAPSTFLDCRSLQIVRYTNSVGGIAFGNDKITEIGDHAFDSCVSLRDFYSPKKVTYFGESAFKNCQSLINFYFPSTIIEAGDITNYITVRSFAFADCKSLVFVYFETNMKEIDNYAFIDCNETLGIKYNGTSIPSYKKDGVSQTHWRDTRISTSSTAVVPIQINHPTIHSDDDYPCFRYTLESTVVLLDSAQNRATQIEVINQTEIDSEGEYAVIYKFDTPSEDLGCYTVNSGKLTIPDTLNGKIVKVIGAQAFANNLAIKSVTFNANLRQIRNKAFFNCLNIAELDFSLCQRLKEVSYYIFNDGNVSTANLFLSSLILPDSLEFIGGYAFSCLYNVNEFSLPSNIKAIDDLAFYRLGFNVIDAKIDLLLPKSLSDAEAAKANFKHLPKGSFRHDDYTRFYAVGKYSFNEAKAIRTVTMEDDDEHENDNSYSCSFYSNVFYGASNLIRFKASKNLKYLGKDIFKNCTGLREVFLTTAKSQSTGDPYPWCINEEDGQYGGTLFFGTVPECVCYVDGASAPGLLESYSLTTEVRDPSQLNSLWNSESTGSYFNEGKSSSNLNRSRIPTYYSVDFENDIKYWDPKGKKFISAPTTLEQYNSGFIVFVKEANNKYTAARYFYDIDSQTGSDYIDLTAIPGISDGTTNDLTKIGEEAFAKHTTITGTNDARLKQPGLYFVLPTTITTISERAFYRATNANSEPNKGNGRYGVRIVTYKVGDKYIGTNGSEQLTLSQFKTVITNLEKNLDVNKRGYCALPSNVSYIGIDAFYNNIFQKVYLPSALTFIGSGAFYCNSAGSESRTTIATVSLTGNSYFSVSNNGIYYVGGGNGKKMLMYQAAANTGTLTIASNTKAIGLEGCANTKYSTINLPSGLTTIYGGGLTKNVSLTTLSGVSSLKYIGAMENALNPTADEIWDSTVADHFSNTDYRDYAYEPRPQIDSLFGAISGCSKLDTIDIKSMTQLRKIGHSAFSGNSKMKFMSGSVNYVFKSYNSSTGATSTITGRSANNANVCDLSNCSNLRSINRDAFKDCNELKYLILPNNRGGASESTLYIGYDPEAPTIDKSKGTILTKDKGTNILVGETAEYANHDFGTEHNAAEHYWANCFGESGNNVYYYVGVASDIPSDDSSTLKYWTKDGSGNYILLNNAVDARKYFGVN